MRPLLFSNTWMRAGKTLVLIAVGLKLKKRGIKISYFKPLGTSPKKHGSIVTNSSSILIKEALGIDAPLDKLCPVILTQDLKIQAFKGEAAQLKEKVLRRYKELSKNKDTVLIEGGGNLYRGIFLGFCDISLARGLNSHVILIDKFTPDISVDSILAAKENFGQRLIGVVLNHIPHLNMDLVKGRIVDFLKRKGIDVLACLPQDDMLNSISVNELNGKLGGEVLCCQDRQDQLVEHFSIGAMTMEKALGYFKRYRNKAVITGGDRPDIQLAALETSTRALILTGNMYPNDIIMAKAEEKGVPIIVVKGDTLSTVELVESALRRLEIGDERKIKRGLELINGALDWKLLYKKIGL